MATIEIIAWAFIAVISVLLFYAITKSLNN